MPTLQEEIDLPGGVAPSTVRVRVTLWGSGEPVDAVETATNKLVGGTQVVTGNPWTVTDVTANTALSQPAGTVYRVERTWPGLPEPITTYCSMPASGGPYTPKQLEVDPPDDLPTVEPTNELDVSEITGNLTLTGFNGFNILQVPGMTVTKPAVDRPCWSRAQVWMEHASAANVNLATMIGNTGLSIIGTQLAAGIGFVGPAGAETSPEAWARYASGSAAVDQDVYVYSTIAGNVNVIANGSNPLRHVVFGM